MHGPGQFRQVVDIVGFARDVQVGGFMRVAHADARTVRDGGRFRGLVEPRCGIATVVGERFGADGLVLHRLVAQGLVLNRLVADHVTMSFLTWFMTLAAASLIVAFTLAWRPRALAVLAEPFVRAR